MVVVRARFDGKVFVPEEPVALPEGVSLRLHCEPVEAEAARRVVSADELLAFLDQFPENPNLPADLSEQHDHYLYGTPKRPSP